MTSDQTYAGRVQKRRPARTYKREQERISRHKLLKTTPIYTTYSIVLIVLAARAGHPLSALAYFFGGGIPLWMAIEYFSHRYILHRHFQVSKKWYKKHLSILANKFLDPMHFGHHERPFDGHHISGRVRDMLPMLLVFGPLSIWLFPPYTASLVVAGALQGYIFEEWIHHATHYYHFRDPYFRYMKKHHLYHHTTRGMTRGFGTSSGILDFIFQTRFPENVRQRLYGSKKSFTSEHTEQPIQQA